MEGGHQMKVDRLVSIIMILLEKERIGAQELADLFEVSPRTIYRDIDTINMAGIPVRSTSGVGGGYKEGPPEWHAHGGPDAHEFGGSGRFLVGN